MTANTSRSTRRAVLKVNEHTRYESHLESLYGPPPQNPFKRLRNSMELTIDDLAFKMYASKQAIIRLEQGCFDSPLPVAVDFWVNNMGFITELQLTDQYEEFQEKQRERHHQYFGPTLEVIINKPSSIHPLRQLREKHPYFPVNITEVSKALCLPQATLQHWEKKWRTQQSVPRTFQTVLMSIGYGKYQVNDFNIAYYQWRHMKLGRLTVPTNFEAHTDTPPEFLKQLDEEGLGA